jgi:hypothetical protein
VQPPDFDNQAELSWKTPTHGLNLAAQIIATSGLMNNWQDIDSCIGTPKEALSTRCGGQGVVIFYGMDKPVRAPQIGPARPY